MTEYQVNIPPEIINPIYRQYLDDKTRTQIYFGGSASGKSVSLAQKAIENILHGGRNWLICRAVQKNNRQSTFAECRKIITTWKLSELFTINKTDMTITCINDYQIIFAGLDDVEKIKSITPLVGVITDIWVEEATQVDDQSKIKQLEKRLRGGGVENKCLILSFNPILQTHWIAKEYFAQTGMTWSNTAKESATGESIAKEYRTDELLIVKTTHWDNEFLTVQDHKQLESEVDEYFYNVYTLGNWGVLGDVIFTNWHVKDLTSMKNTFDNYRYGIDFGFSADPATVHQSHYDKRDKIIYITGELYEKGLTNDGLYNAAYPIIGRGFVKADSAEPKSIYELKSKGMHITGAMKGKDSILFGIQWLQQQTIYVDPSCVNTIMELQQYQWKKDKDGNSTNIPVDKNNHLIDAIRYAYDDDMEERRVTLSFGSKSRTWRDYEKDKDNGKQRPAY